MKNGTVYATRVKKVFASQRQAAPKPDIPDADCPLRRLGIGILGVGCAESTATRAIDRLLNVMVDWNEVRVSSAREVDAATGGTVPDGVARCQQLIDALNAIYDRENSLSLDGLRGMGVREARQYLEGLNGVDEFAVASVVLWSLGGHAIPVNDRLLKALHDVDLVHPAASRSEVQAFLERNISAADAREFCLIMSSFSPTKKTTAKRSSKRKKTQGTKKTKKTVKSKK